ncbi:MAG: hypothetical protein GY816_23385 [Cytophagales bacterium]|nr:hypothetical protein [Cytophagales bacterium]
MNRFDKWSKWLLAVLTILLALHMFGITKKAFGSNFKPYWVESKAEGNYTQVIKTWIEHRDQEWK